MKSRDIRREITPLEKWIAAKIGWNNQPLTREVIQAYQLQALQKTIAWASTKSSFYQKHLAKLPADCLQDLDCLPRFPFTTAEDLSQNPLSFLCVSQDKISRVVTLQSSGTSGPPKRIYFTQEDLESTVDFFHFGMSTFTNPGDRVLILLPGERPGSVGDLLSKGLERMECWGIRHGPVKDVPETLQIMAREKIDILVGIPSQVLALARFSQGQAAPKTILLSTDYVPSALVQELERIWHCSIYAHYGMTEMGYGGGVECSARCGYHMREADLNFEIVDPASGKSLPDGEWGEVVFTTLRRCGMPLIRYRTGDVTRFLPQKCGCGTVLKTMEPVKHRISGRIELFKDEWISLADLDEALFGIHRVVDFEARLVRQENKDCLAIEAIVTEEPSPDATLDMRQALLSNQSIRKAIEQNLLTISIQTRIGAGQTSPTPAKRKLTDERSPGVTE